jgi:hypothetical protein
MLADARDRISEEEAKSSLLLQVTSLSPSLDPFDILSLCHPLS